MGHAMPDACKHKPSDVIMVKQLQQQLLLFTLPILEHHWPCAMLVGAVHGMHAWANMAMRHVGGRVWHACLGNHGHETICFPQTNHYTD